MLETQWHESSFDPHLYLQLQDLTTVLSNIEDMTFEFTYGSFIDVIEKRLTADTFWETTNGITKQAGFTTDIYLRAIGTLHYTHLPVFQSFMKTIEQVNLTSFASQLFTLLEDIRLEKEIIRLRPGTKNEFNNRHTYLHHYFTTQRKTNIVRSMPLDELFCMIYLTLYADGPDPSFTRANNKQLVNLEQIEFDLFTVFEATSTKEVVFITENILQKLIDYNVDMKTTYFTSPIVQLNKTVRENTLFDELTRTDDVTSYMIEKVDEENQDYMDETFSTWHDEHKNEGRKETFLQMDLDVGTKTNLMGGEARETESGDQAFAAAQGTARQSKQKDYSALEALTDYDENAGNKSHAPYGEDNINAVKNVKWATKPTTEEIQQYDLYLSQIQLYKRQLSATIEKILEHQQTSPQSNLHFGRLSNQLLPVVFEDFPRLFYKKNDESNLFDANFTLMIDCSASMDQKMDETKRGVTLFHEVLKQLHIPHQIIGFWEEATLTHDESYPNYFHMIHTFSDSLHENNGAKIMQLQPEEDNRDGFSIRVVTEDIIKRQEKHKFLLVFSDGEPAAMNYNENGIIDTYLAVSEARKKGINVLGMFLADGKIAEQDDNLMKNIYGHERLMIPQIEQLPELFTPILKRLLLSTL